MDCQRNVSLLFIRFVVCFFIRFSAELAFSYLTNKHTSHNIIFQIFKDSYLFWCKYIFWTDGASTRLTRSHRCLLHMRQCDSEWRRAFIWTIHAFCVRYELRRYVVRTNETTKMNLLCASVRTSEYYCPLLRLNQRTNISKFDASVIGCSIRSNFVFTLIFTISCSYVSGARFVYLWARWVAETHSICK